MRIADLSPGSQEEASDLPMHPSRILVVAPEPFYENRGTPIALKHVLGALSDLCHEVDLLTFPVGEPVTMPGLRIFRVGTWLPIREVPIGFSIRKVLLDAFLVPAILRRTSRARYTYVYALEEAAFLALLLRPWHRLPVIYDMQSSLPEQLEEHPFFGNAALQKALLFVERWMIRKADEIICSAGLYEYILSIDPDASVREWCYPSEQVELAADDSDRLRAEFGIAPESRVVAYTGNLEAYQGVMRLIAAIPKVVSEVPNTLFLIVGGDGAFKDSLPESADRLQKQGVLKCIPQQPRPQVKRVLGMAEVLVSPRNDTRNIGIKIFEYMAAGKPIVATDIPAHRAFLNEDRAVLVGLSPEEMGSAIVRLLRDRNAANRLGEAARVYAKQHMSDKIFTDQVMYLFNKIRDENAKAPR